MTDFHAGSDFHEGRDKVLGSSEISKVVKQLYDKELLLEIVGQDIDKFTQYKTYGSLIGLKFNKNNPELALPVKIGVENAFFGNFIEVFAKYKLELDYGVHTTFSETYQHDKFDKAKVTPDLISDDTIYEVKTINRETLKRQMGELNIGYTLQVWYQMFTSGFRKANILPLTFSFPSMFAETEKVERCIFMYEVHKRMESESITMDMLKDYNNHPVALKLIQDYVHCFSYALEEQLLQVHWIDDINDFFEDILTKWDLYLKGELQVNDLSIDDLDPTSINQLLDSVVEMIPYGELDVSKIPELDSEMEEICESIIRDKANVASNQEKFKKYAIQNGKSIYKGTKKVYGIKQTGRGKTVFSSKL